MAGRDVDPARMPRAGVRSIERWRKILSTIHRRRFLASGSGVPGSRIRWMWAAAVVAIDWTVCFSLYTADCATRRHGAASSPNES